MGTSNLFDTKRKKLVYSSPSPLVVPNAKKKKVTSNELTRLSMLRGRGFSPFAASSPPSHSSTEKKGVISVISEPSNARVYVDDEKIGKTPLKITALEGDIVHLRISLKGYKTFKTECMVGDDINVVLKRYGRK